MFNSVVISRLGSPTKILSFPCLLSNEQSIFALELFLIQVEERNKSG